MRNQITNNGLSPSMVIRYIHSQLGTSVQTIELNEKDWWRIITQQSLRTFSQYFPFLPIVNLTRDDAINNSCTEYRIPNQWNLEILSLHKYYLSSENQFAGGWVSPFLANPIDAQIFNDSMSMFICPLIIDYYPPNKVVVKQNFYNLYGLLSLQFKAVHPAHLKTIEPNLRDDFLHLCLYDVLLSLYPIRHRFSNYSTVYGTLEPFFDMVDSAKDNRDALIEKWKEKYLFSGSQKKVWIG